MTHAEIIEGLGGSGKVAADLTSQAGEAVLQSTVSNWIQRGIPWRWRGEVKKLAECNGVALPDDFLAAT